MSSEKSIASARASVMIYDDVNKKWMPSGTSSGLSKVHVFQHQVNNTFRVVGRKLQNQEVVINCVILKSLKYNQATATFHQWRDNKQVYGLNFSSKEDADAFAHAMLYAVEVLASAPRPTIQQFPSPPVYPQTNGQYEEDMGYRPIIPMQQTPVAPLQTNIVYSEHNLNHSLNNNHQPPLSHLQQDMPQVRTMTREDVAVLQERRMSQQSQMSSPSAVSPPGGPSVGGPTPPGHHRTSSAPPAPQPPPLSVPPPPPPAPPSCPPPPPFPMSSGASTLPRSSSTDLSSQHIHCAPSQDSGSLAAQLQSARLKRASKQSAENSGSSTTSSSSGAGSAGGYSTLGRGSNTGMASMMDEMAKTLARRRAAVEKKDPEPNTSAQDSEGSGSVERRAGSVGSVTWNSNNKSGSTGVATNGWESPKTSRKNLAASSEDVARQVNGEVNGSSGGYITPADLDNVKQEILREMRRELGKMKTEIVDAIKLELSKR